MKNNNQEDKYYLKTLSVLYVEDEKDIREELATFLRRRVAKVYTAVNGQEGLDMFTQHQPDLVITDILMPQMNGLVMVEHIRAINAKTPVIITTAFEDPRYFHQAIDLGVDNYVTKPVKLDIFISALQKCARSIRAEAALVEISERYRLLFRLSHIAISVLTTGSIKSKAPSVRCMDGLIIDCNEAFLALLGYAHQDDLTALHFSDLLLPEAFSLLNKLIQDDLLVHDFSHEYQLELRHKEDGHAVPVIAQFILRRDAKGQASEVWAVMRDITEQQHSEQALRLAACVFENSDEAILVTDQDNRIVTANQACTRHTGYCPGEIIGQNPSFLKSGKHDQAFYEQMWQCLQTNGHWQGEIWNRRKDGDIYPEWLSISMVHDSQGHITNYIAIFYDISAIKAATAHIEFLAHYDPLTQLINRKMLEERTVQALLLAVRNKTQLALMFINLDRFKIINDTLGQSIGDKLLKSVALRLREMTREVDIVARLGGDEFVIVLPCIESSSDATIVVNKLIAVLDEPILIAEHFLTITSSIGISLFPDDGLDYETLLRHANAAMFSAKKSGSNKFMYFSSGMNSNLEKQLQIEHELRHALKKQEFELYYQPQVNLKSGRIIGVEALLRWNSVVFGMVSPDCFIPLAEEIGLIVAIGEWVLREACRQNAKWQRQGLPAVVVAVNLSAIQFRQKNLVDIVLSALQDSALPPEYLELELTEGIVMQDVDNTIDCLHNLKQLGIKLSIDDFGTGYSSLSYLKRFPINKLKIDKSFIHDIANDADDEKIVRAVIGLAQAMNLTVIAEGVETQEQLSFLRSHQCDEMQGYLCSKPLPADEMAKFLERGNLL
jgi:diguanylate cyclase (GGDEF)-like protein/PAS domain S-box-containing protein